MIKSQKSFESPLGKLYIVANERGLIGIYWEKQKLPISRGSKMNPVSEKILAMTALQLNEYFKGSRQTFDLPLYLEGTPFQKKVWRELQKIPYGRTFSYAEIARRIKKPKAFRATGTANGRNPLCIIIPCHRVISSDGSLGGYSGGLEKKLKLLRLEGNLTH